MLLNEALSFLTRYWPWVLLGSLIAKLVYNKFYNGLHKYPGPFLAAYTDWWRLFDVWGRQTHTTHIALHRKYGDIVRLGPGVLSFADPKAIKVIYGLNKGMIKVRLDQNQR